MNKTVFNEDWLNGTQFEWFDWLTLKAMSPRL